MSLAPLLTFRQLVKMYIFQFPNFSRFSSFFSIFVIFLDFRHFLIFGPTFQNLVIFSSRPVVTEFRHHFHFNRENVPRPKISTWFDRVRPGFWLRAQGRSCFFSTITVGLAGQALFSGSNLVRSWQSLSSQLGHFLQHLSFSSALWRLSPHV